MFPEGKINQTLDMLKFKWGIGRLLMESSNLPIVVPLWHKGIDIYNTHTHIQCLFIYS